MTTQQKQSHAARFRKFVTSREQFYSPKVQKALQDQYRDFIFNYNYYGNGAIEKIDAAPLTRIITHLTRDAVQVYGQKVIADLRQARTAKSYHYADVVKKGGSAGGFAGPKGYSARLNSLPISQLEYEGMELKRMPIDRIAEIMRQYFTIDILNNVQDITQTTKEFLLRPDIQELFIEAYKRGDGIDQMVRMFSGLQNNRGQLIARTETVTAANKSALVVAKDTGLELLKEWLPTNDFRTRDHHREMAGQKVGQDDYFMVKSDKGVTYQMDAPGDRGGKEGRVRVPPDLVCNCRCTVIHEVVE